MVWHFCRKSDSRKTERLQERALTVFIRISAQPQGRTIIFWTWEGAGKVGKKLFTEAVKSEINCMQVKKKVFVARAAYTTPPPPPTLPQKNNVPSLAPPPTSNKRPS